MGIPNAARVLIVLAAVAVGCGGGGDDGTGGGEPITAEPLSRAAYVEQADAICRRIGEETVGYVDEAYGELDDSEALSEAADNELAERITERQREGLDELRALPAPSGDEAEVERLVASGERAIEQLSRIQLEDPGGEAPALEEFDELARAYGLDGCAAAAPE